MSTARPRAATSSSAQALAGPEGRPSATYLLLLLNLAVFVGMTASGGRLLQFGTDEVLRWGANYGPLTMNGQWWRLVSTMFVHIGLVHFAVNMWALYELGTLAEQIYGARTTLWLYFLAGVAGSIASLVRSPVIISAGASGAIFGVAGVLIATLALGRLVMRSRALTIALASLLAFAGYNLSYGFLKGGIDNGAHLGGLLFGLALGVALSAGLGRERRLTANRRYYVFSASVLALVVGFSLVKQARGQQAVIQSARQALETGDPDLAIRRLVGAGKKPSADFYSLLGAAYAEKRQYQLSVGYYQKALRLNPKDASARRGLGLLAIQAGRVDEGRKQLEEAVQLDPTSDAAWLQLGLIWQREGNYPQSLACLQKAVAINPNSAPAQFALGISAMNLRQYDAAVAAFQRAAQLSPNDYTAQIWLANAYQAKGMGREASVAYARAQLLRRPAQRGQTRR